MSDTVSNQNSTSTTNNVDVLSTTIDEELALSKSSLQIIEAKWKKILCTEKIELLTKEASYLKEQYTAEIKQKDDIISKLIQKFDNKHEEIRITTAIHLQTLDDIVTMFDGLLINLEKDLLDKLHT